MEEEALVSSFLFRKVMIDKGLIENIAEGFLVSKESLFLVDVVIRPGNTILVEIDSIQDGINIDDCIALSKYIESKLDRETEDFELEVGSAGVTSPFKIKKQYDKNIGNEVEVLTKTGTKLSGVLKSCDDDSFVITTLKKVKPEGAKRKIDVEEDFSFKYEEVKYTKYLIRFK